MSGDIFISVCNIFLLVGGPVSQRYQNRVFITTEYLFSLFVVVYFILQYWSRTSGNTVVRSVFDALSIGDRVSCSLFFVIR